MVDLCNLENLSQWASKTGHSLVIFLKPFSSRGQSYIYLSVWRNKIQNFLKPFSASKISYLHFSKFPFPPHEITVRP